MIVGAVGAFLVLAASAAALSSNLRVVARWNVSEKGSVTHTWSEPSAKPCEPSGDGRVTTTFGSSHPGHIVIADNGYGLGDFSWDGNLRVTGTITAADNRVRNPPAANETCVDQGAPVPDTRACGTARFTDLMQVNPPSRRGSKYPYDGALPVADVLDAPDGTNIPDCETGGFSGFSQIYGGSGSVAHQALLIAYPSEATLARRRGTFTVSAHDTRHFNGFSTTTRRVTLTFHRTR